MQNSGSPWEGAATVPHTRAGLDDSGGANALPATAYNHNSSVDKAIPVDDVLGRQWMEELTDASCGSLTYQDAFRISRKSRPRSSDGTRLLLCQYLLDPAADALYSVDAGGDG
jgi:hypothetical protein